MCNLEHVSTDCLVWWIWSGDGESGDGKLNNIMCMSLLALTSILTSILCLVMGKVMGDGRICHLIVL